MIIVTQDEETIVNFDDVTKIYIKNPFENNDGEFEIRAENVWNVNFLGYYKTKERAKEVLQEIVSTYQINTVYEMPKE